MDIFNVGNKIKELRRKSKLSQKQFAKRVGVSKSCISYDELHIRLPRSDVLASISETFHVSDDYLLGLDKVKRADLSGLNEEDIELVKNLIDVLKRKN